MSVDFCIYCESKLVPTDFQNASIMRCGICKITIGCFCMKCFTGKVSNKPIVAYAGTKAKIIRDKHEEEMHHSSDLI